jgi:hypothetical protein
MVLEIVGAIGFLAVAANEMGGLKNCFDFEEDKLND